MKIPKNLQMRLGKDVWIAAETLARYYGSDSRRDALEKGIHELIMQKIQTDSRFSEVWHSVKSEGVTNE